MRLLAASTVTILAGVVLGNTWSLWPLLVLAVALAWFLAEIVAEFDRLHREDDDLAPIPNPYRKDDR